ncbi:MAG: OadG family protein [Bacteroides sp.]|nr:OadG family protein [Bacteroides sp.]
MKKLGILIVALVAVCGNTFGQGAKSLVINEVLVNNKTNFQDDYGQHHAWIELFNPTFATVDVRNCYLTCDKRVLDESLSAPERAALMYPIPKGDVLTKIPPRQHLLFWADAQPKRGNFHLNFELDSVGPNWIALYDGNAITLIDSITIPANIPVDCSYALKMDGIKGGPEAWNIVGQNNTFVTPSTNNVTLDTNEKIDAFKEKDPHGIGMAIMAMLVVFSGLIVLYLAFKVVGTIGMKIAQRNAMRHHGIEDAKEAKEKNVGTESAEIYAAIAMALHEFQSDVHDVENTVLTINKVKRNYSPWSSKIYTLRNLPK